MVLQYGCKSCLKPLTSSRQAGISLSVAFPKLYSWTAPPGIALAQCLRNNSAPTQSALTLANNKSKTLKDRSKISARHDGEAFLRHLRVLASTVRTLLRHVRRTTDGSLSETPPKNPSEERVTSTSYNVSAEQHTVNGTGKRACFRVVWVPPAAVVVAARPRPVSAVGRRHNYCSAGDSGSLRARWQSAVHYQPGFPERLG